MTAAPRRTGDAAHRSPPRTSRSRAGARVAALLVALLSAATGVLPVTPAGHAEPAARQFLSVRIDAVTPDVVTTGSGPQVTVSGVVTNVGDRTVRDVVVRLEHAGAVIDPVGLRTVLGGPTTAFEPVGEFVTVSGALERGASVPFRLSSPLRAATGPAVGVTAPGIYPMLVNANGTPAFGAPARLDDGRFLLPVIGVPAPGIASPRDTSRADTAPPSGAGIGDVVAPDTTRPVALTLLWPLADRPRLAPGQPGAVAPVRLADDDLAVSLAPGGRLETLLAAAEFATGPQVDPSGAVRSALCLAVDPDLVVTVNAMTTGYVVSDDAADRASAVRPGTGTAAAAAWLARLRTLAATTCTVATPYAQADLDALHRVGDPGLSDIATTGAGAVVDQLLGVRSLGGIAVLADSRLTGAAADVLAAQPSTVAVAAGDDASGDPGNDVRADSEDGVGPVGGLDAGVPDRALRVLPYDPSVAAALAAAGTEAVTPSYVSIPVEADASAVARRQDAIAAMLWRTLTPDVSPRTELLVPPPVWSPSAQDAAAVLRTLATAVNSGLATPRPLEQLVADARPPGPAAPDRDRTAAPDTAGRFSDGVVGDVTEQVRRLWGLTAAMTTDPRTGLTGIGYTAPLREDMLRALSRSVPPVVRDAAARARMAATGATVTDMVRAVSVVNPGGSYTLATERSPLPLALRNDLPLPIRVRLRVDAPPGMSVTDIGEQVLPPGYLPLRVPVEVHFTQRVAVDVDLQTPAGMPLGEPVRLSVHSNAYGKVLFALTMTAVAVLVALVGRRLWHRFRGRPDPADLDRPAPR